jgi:hypothetical protein
MLILDLKGADMALTLIRRPEPAVTSPPRKRRRRWPAIVTAGLGGVLLLAAFGWQRVAVPALVKFPTDVDQRPRYEGTFTLFVDPATAAPLVEPTTAALGVDRHVEALSDESDSSRVVVRETITFDVEGLASATQVHQYVMNRRSNVNVADDRAWAFEETNVLDRSDAYWVALPTDIDSTSTVPLFKDEVGGRFTATGESETEVVADLDLVAVATAPTTMPLTDSYLRSLDAAIPLPRALGFEALKPSLIAAGVPVDEAMEALLQVATPEELATLSELIAQPIPLEYVVTFGGTIFADPRTGAIVDVKSIVDRIGVRPAAEALPPLLTVLERHGDEAAIGAAIDGLDRLATEPLPVFEYRYAQTAGSAQEIARWVSDQHDRIDLAERTIPLTLVAIGSLAVVIGGFLLVRSGGRRRIKT